MYSPSLINDLSSNCKNKLSFHVLRNEPGFVIKASCYYYVMEAIDGFIYWLHHELTVLLKLHVSLELIGFFYQILYRIVELKRSTLPSIAFMLCELSYVR